MARGVLAGRREANNGPRVSELLTVFSESGASLIGEDLGTVPDFLRVSLAERGHSGDEGHALGARTGTQPVSRSTM